MYGFFVFCSSCSKISSHVRRDLFVFWILQASVELWGLENDHRSHSKLFLFCQLRVERWSFLEKINIQYNGIVEFNSLVLQSNANQLFPEWCQDVQSWCCIFLNWSCKVPLKNIYLSVKGLLLEQWKFSCNMKEIFSVGHINNKRTLSGGIMSLLTRGRFQTGLDITPLWYLRNQRSRLALMQERREMNQQALLGHRAYLSVWWQGDFII